MALKPIFAPASREQLMEKFELEFPLSEWTSITFPVEEVYNLDEDLSERDAVQSGYVDYETNRYDVEFEDIAENKKICWYVYMNESSTEVIAVDTVVQDAEEPDARYSVSETPLQNVIELLESNRL